MFRAGKANWKVCNSHRSHAASLSAVQSLAPFCGRAVDSEANRTLASKCLQELVQLVALGGMPKCR